MAALLVVITLLGLAIGSFLNVVIHRVPRGESLVRPPSRCPACGSRIRNRHNIPVLGWLILRGRCASCGAPISARHPLVELGTGLLFLTVSLHLSHLDLLSALNPACPGLVQSCPVLVQRGGGLAPAISSRLAAGRRDSAAGRRDTPGRA